MKKIYWFIFICISVSCSKEKSIAVYSRPATCDSALYPDGKRFTFIQDILPILNSYCNFGECHGTGGDAIYDFTRYADVADRARSGTLQYRLELPFGHPKHMPVDMKLNACDYYAINTWINQKFPER